MAVSGALSGAGSVSSPGAITGPALALDRVVKRYGARTVLDRLTMTVERGELVALLGPNGAGKTTAVEMLEGYRAADGGTVRVLGEDPRRGGPALKARIGVMLQDGGLDPRTTPRDTLRLYAALHDQPRSPDALLDLVGLTSVARTRVRRLSGGERQRLALAVALVGDPEVLILDEPTAGMDPEARRAARALIAGLRSEGRAVLMTTHDLGDVERLADRVLILHGGRLVADGTPSALAAGAIPRLRVRLERALSADELGAFGAAISSVVPGAVPAPEPGEAAGAILVDGVAPDPDLVAAVASWCAASRIQIVELRAAAATLEERYLSLTGDRAVEAVA
ncbi:MAG: ABC transporter ATP-binding protein [Chloroflexi bacterium]|nr:ABC transporter ATP-binding protein [Chloroflexota bacterium]